jgi:hypothetical protein
MEDYKYLIRFPPHKQVAATLISDTTYFKMCKEGVLVSLKAWNGDIDPYDSLEEAWVQISGVPPKWCNWKTFIQIASSLGKMIEIDCNSLFTSFFGMVRIKVECKDISKIPKKRLFEMKKKLYLIQFKVERVENHKGGADEDGGDNSDPNNDDELMEEDWEQDMESEPEKKQEGGSGGKVNLVGSAGPKATPMSSKRVMDWVSLFQNSEENKMLQETEVGQYSCAKLLREMEATESEFEEGDVMMGITVEEELVQLPEAWSVNRAEMESCDGLPDNLYVLPDVRSGKFDGREDMVGEGAQNRKDLKKQWGPVLVEKRSSRRPLDGRTTLEKAQERKKLHNLRSLKVNPNHRTLVIF